MDPDVSGQGIVLIFKSQMPSIVEKSNIALKIKSLCASESRGPISVAASCPRRTKPSTIKIVINPAKTQQFILLLSITLFGLKEHQDKHKNKMRSFRPNLQWSIINCCVLTGFITILKKKVKAVP